MMTEYSIHNRLESCAVPMLLKVTYFQPFGTEKYSNVKIMKSISIPFRHCKTLINNSRKLAFV